MVNVNLNNGDMEGIGRCNGIHNHKSDNMGVCEKRCCPTIQCFVKSWHDLVAGFGYPGILILRHSRMVVVQKNAGYPNLWAVYGISMADMMSRLQFLDINFQ